MQVSSGLLQRNKTIWNLLLSKSRHISVDTINLQSEITNTSH